MGRFRTALCSSVPLQLQWPPAQTQQPDFSSRTTPVLHLMQPALTMAQPSLSLLLQTLCKPQHRASAAARLALQPPPSGIQREESLPAGQRPPEKPVHPPCLTVSCRGQPQMQVPDRGGCGASLPSSAGRQSGLNLRSRLTGIALWTESAAGLVRWLRLQPLSCRSTCVVCRDTGGQANARWRHGCQAHSEPQGLHMQAPHLHITSVLPSTPQW